MTSFGLLSSLPRKCVASASRVAVGVLADERARRVLADEQVALGVVDDPVGLVGGPHDLGDAVCLAPAPAHVAGHVAEQQELARGVPDRPLGEGEPGAEPLDLRVLVDELAQRVGLHDRHPSPLPSVKSGILMARRRAPAFRDAAQAAVRVDVVGSVVVGVGLLVEEGGEIVVSGLHLGILTVPRTSSLPPSSSISVTVTEPVNGSRVPPWCCRPCPERAGRR